MGEQLVYTELPPGSREAFIGALNTMAHDLPEVAARRAELEASGLTLIAENGLEPTFFDNEGRSRLFVGLAGNYAEVTAMEASPATTPALAEIQKAVAKRERQFIDDCIAVIGHDFSQHPRLAEAKDDIEFTYETVNGTRRPEWMAKAYEKYTDAERSAAVQRFIDEHDLFADQRQLVGGKENERPYTIRVIRLRNDRDADVNARATFLRDIGMVVFNHLPAGWIAQEEERVICLTEDIADTILNHDTGTPYMLNYGINVLRHEKAHLEYNWRLPNSVIGNGLNEMGAEVLAGLLPNSWSYAPLRDLKDHFNESLNDGGDNIC